MSEAKMVQASELENQVTELKVKLEECKKQESTAKVQLPPLIAERKMFRQKFFVLRQKKAEEGISEDEEDQLNSYRSIMLRVMKTIRKFETQISKAEDFVPRLVDSLKQKTDMLAILQKQILEDAVYGNPAPCVHLMELSLIHI